MIVFKEENFEECLPELAPMFKAHCKEVHAFVDKAPLNPMYEKYIALNELGIIRLHTWRDDGVIIGYAVSFVTENLHYQDHVYAVNDVIYLDKDYRDSGLFTKMLSQLEAVYCEMGCSVMTFHIKTAHPANSIVKYEGMNHIENLYGKWIGE